MGQHLPSPPLESHVSLVTTPTSQLRTCGTCAGTRVTHITMTLTDGSSVDFTSCHTCENRSWTQGKASLDVASVLRKAQKHKPPTT